MKARSIDPTYAFQQTLLLWPSPPVEEAGELIFFGVVAIIDIPAASLGDAYASEMNVICNDVTT